MPFTCAAIKDSASMVLPLMLLEGLRRLRASVFGLQENGSRPSSRPAATYGLTAIIRGLMTNVRYRVLWMAFLLALVTFLDRVCISIAAPYMMQDLGLTMV